MQDFSQILTGKSRAHLVPLPNALSAHHFLQADTVKAFLALQKAAKNAGFNLQSASSFRDFERQKLIWNGKFSGERKVHNAQGETLDLSLMNDWQKAEAILRWSAVAGASRHHWGTEIDVFDPDLLPENQPLMLEPSEYQAGGYFADFANWLAENVAKFDFALPFCAPHGKEIGAEPWHISYLPTAKRYQAQFCPDLLRKAWKGEDLAGKECLLAHLDELFERFIL